MNDFPIPEDPPVTMTVEKAFKASVGEGMTMIEPRYFAGTGYSAPAWSKTDNTQKQ